MVNGESFENIKYQEPVGDNIGGISNIKTDRQIGINKGYLDFAAYSGSDSVTGTAVGAVTYTADTTQIIPFSSIIDSSGKYPWKISATGGAVVPIDGTYTINCVLIFNMAGNTSGKTSSDIVAQFGNIALLSFISQATSEGAAKSFVYYESKRFDFSVDCANFGFSGNLQKGLVLYLQAAHKWDGVSFPVYSTLYITKIS